MMSRWCGDCYLDNIIKVFLGIIEIIKQYAVSPSLALQVSMRPLADDKPIPRNETLSVPKFEAKGTPRELMVVLGWWLDTHITDCCYVFQMKSLRHMIMS